VSCSKVPHFRQRATFPLSQFEGRVTDLG
jgi:hypothetical protein